MIVAQSDSFSGAIIVVSHDRYFLDRITTHLFAIQHRQMVPYIGGYQSYLDAIAEEASPAPVVKKAEPAAPAAKKNNYDLRFSFKEQRDLETIDDRIASLEEKLASLEQEIEAHAAEYTRVTELMQQQEQTQQELDEAMERWMYLQEKKERIEAAGK